MREGFMSEVLVKTVFVPHENANMIFPIINGKPVLDIVWIHRPFTWWKKISRRIYLSKVREFRKERRRFMVYMGREYSEGSFTLIFGVKNNEAPSMWEMVNTWRKHGPRDFDRSI
jgi:hypothetical protein